MELLQMEMPKWDFRLMFLRDLHKANINKINQSNLNIYYNQLGDLQYVIQRLIEDGLLKSATIYDQIDIKMTVADLKVSLKERGLKVSGKKLDLIMRLKPSLILKTSPF